MSETTGALRYNAGKLRYDLIPPSWTRALARVLGKGAEKYSARNWEKGLPLMQVLASAERHLNAYKTGEDNDRETGEPHLAHAAWNLLAALETHRRVYETPLAPLPLELDDRPEEWDEYIPTPAPEACRPRDTELDANGCESCHYVAACAYAGRCLQSAMREIRSAAI
jgi:hypothetical protein